ncbi:MAG: carbohydrate kinase [Pseudomonadota bacterium]
MYLVCGEALYDLFAGDGSQPDQFSIEARAGGSPFNVAIGISRLSGNSALLTGVSNDLLGQRLVSMLKRESVSTEYLVRSGNRTTLSLVGIEPDGQPNYVFYGLGSADCSLEAVELPNIGNDISALHFGSYSLVVKPVADAFSKLLHTCGDRFVSVDPNVRLNVEPEIDIWRERILEYAGKANLLKISVEDLESLYPKTSKESKAADWISQGIDLVIVTDGGNAVSAWSKSSETAYITPRAAKVVDTVGAGDSFQAALLYRLAKSGKGDPLAAIRALDADGLSELLSFCAAAAAVTCERRGANLPTLSDLKTRR